MRVVTCFLLCVLMLGATTSASEEMGQETAYVNKTDLYFLLNKNIFINATYRPADLVMPDVAFAFQGMDEKKLLRSEAAAALELLFAEAKLEGQLLYAVSGYRSYERQTAVFNNNVLRKGYEQANKTSALPGQSEHQLGLAMDVANATLNINLFEGSSESDWVAANAHRFGFIVRYPLGKEHITGYSYEPWHLRYVGQDIASAIYEQDITLEQFYEKYSVRIKQPLNVIPVKSLKIMRNGHLSAYINAYLMDQKIYVPIRELATLAGLTSAHFGIDPANSFYWLEGKRSFLKTRAGAPFQIMWDRSTYPHQQRKYHETIVVETYPKFRNKPNDITFFTYEGITYAPMNMVFRRLSQDKVLAIWNPSTRAIEVSSFIFPIKASFL
jgi:D-alanyl-D-alanine carboxypeptidase